MILGPTTSDMYVYCIFAHSSFPITNYCIPGFPCLSNFDMINRIWQGELVLCLQGQKGGLYRLRNALLHRLYVSRTLYGLYDTIRFLHGTARFLYDTIRFSYDTICFLYDMIRFLYNMKRFLYAFHTVCTVSVRYEFNF